MSYHSIKYCFLITEFLGRTEYTFGVHKDDVNTLVELDFEFIYYGNYESKKPYSDIRYLTPPKKVIREVLDMIRMGELKMIGTSPAGTFYDCGLMKRSKKKRIEALNMYLKQPYTYEISIRRA